MAWNLGYLVQRILQRYLLTRRLRKYQIAPGFYHRSHDSKRPRGVQFHLNNPRFVHLGDQLFYEPSVVGLMQIGVPVKVHSSAALARYFSVLGDSLSRDADTLIESSEWLHVVPLASYRPDDWAGKNALIVNFTDTRIASSISGALLETIAQLSQLQTELGQCAPFDRKTVLGALDTDVGFPPHTIVFSNYVDSGAFKITSRARKTLEKAAIRLRAEGFRIVHVGSEHERQSDAATYPFVDLDLRGKTTPLDLLRGFHSANVAGSVTFDTFVMHACLMAGKPSFVRFKGRFSPASTRQHMRYINETLAPPRSRLVTYL